MAFVQPVPAQMNQYLELAMARASARLAQVDHYVERVRGGQIPGLRTGLEPGQSGPCLSNCRVYTTVPITLGDGTTLKAGHLLSPTEVAVLAGVSPDAEFLRGFGDGMVLMQETIAANSGEALGPFAGLAEAAFGDTSLSTLEVIGDADGRSWEGAAVNEREAPWLNPFRLFGAGAGMFYGAANAVEEAQVSLGQSANQALGEAEQANALFANVREVGIEQIDGRAAMHLGFPIPSQASAAAATVDNQEFVPTGASMWIDTEEYVILKHRVEGTVTADGAMREFFIETVNSDYRDVPGSDMYEPYRRVMRMGGMLNDEQMAQMEEARRQLAEFDRQMASMPPEQRSMMEAMMGGQMDAVRGLADGGVFEYVEVIDEILVNSDLNALFSVGPNVFGADNLLQQIQEDLVTLGYEPGNTDGIPDTLTSIAISQFQAEQALEVTGEPSPQLAGILAAEVDRQGGG